MLTHKSIACTLRLRWLLLVGMSRSQCDEFASRTLSHIGVRNRKHFVCCPVWQGFFASATSLPRGKWEKEREARAIEKCKHKNKLDVTRSAKRRRREIESFKNEHRKIYLGEKTGKKENPMGNTGHRNARREKKNCRWTESIRLVLRFVCFGTCARLHYHHFYFCVFKLPVCQPLTLENVFFSARYSWPRCWINYFETIWIYLFCHSFWYIPFFFVSPVGWNVFGFGESVLVFFFPFLLRHELLWNYHNLTIGNHRITLSLVCSRQHFIFIRGGKTSEYNNWAQSVSDSHFWTARTQP